MEKTAIRSDSSVVADRPGNDIQKKVADRSQIGNNVTLFSMLVNTPVSF
jgi:hypothetical protein